jgi:hypothetical protein
MDGPQPREAGAGTARPVAGLTARYRAMPAELGLQPRQGLTNGGGNAKSLLASPQRLTVWEARRIVDAGQSKRLALAAVVPAGTGLARRAQAGRLAPVHPALGSCAPIRRQPCARAGSGP